jgi:hypothetical protein
MEWYHVLAIVLGNLAVMFPLWFWNRAESRADMRHMDNRMDAVRELVHAIHLEMKDFHNRLFIIEERNKK